MNSTQVSLHGVFINIFDVGTLILGKDGIGKSELALTLLDKNPRHQLIADDLPSFTRVAEKVVGTSPPHLQNFMMVRSVGVINISSLFGETSIKDSKALELIIELQELNHHRPQAEFEDLKGINSTKQILDISFPMVTLLVTPNRNLPLLVETVVKSFVLKESTGYDPSSDFERSLQEMGNTHS